jgi:peptide/nickel transport system permease protein
VNPYVARRLLLFIPTLALISIAVFVMLRVLPGDPALVILSGGPGGTGTFTTEQLEALRRQMGLDRPIYVQYVDWLLAMLRGDWGISTRYNVPVLEEIAHRLPTTLELATLSLLIAIGLGIPAGVVSAVRQDTRGDHLIRVLSVAGLAIPPFWLGKLTILALLLLFAWIPPLGFRPLWEDPTTNLQQMAFPALVLGYYFSAYLTRMTRAQLLEVLGQDYIRTAKGKGLRQWVVVIRHALKNALLAVLTLAGLQLGQLLGGSIIVETIFAIPGLGALLVGSLLFRDYTMAQALILVIGVMLVTLNLAVDLLYGRLDPRIRFA